MAPLENEAYDRHSKAFYGKKLLGITKRIVGDCAHAGLGVLCIAGGLQETCPDRIDGRAERCGPEG